jgi:hypothetical protein
MHNSANLWQQLSGTDSKATSGNQKASGKSRKSSKKVGQLNRARAWDWRNQAHSCGDWPRF